MQGIPGSLPATHHSGNRPAAAAGGVSTHSPARGGRLRHACRGLRGHLVAVWVSLVLFVLGGLDRAGAEEDLRVQFGTRSTEVARLIQEGMQKMQGKQIAEGLKDFEKASAADPDCLFALYWMANASSDLGDLERAIELYTRIVERGAREGAGAPDVTWTTGSPPRGSQLPEAMTPARNAGKRRGRWVWPTPASRPGGRRWGT
jgi:hypothetical protein